MEAKAVFIAPLRNYPFTEYQIYEHDRKMIDVLCRANLFANDKDLNR